MKATRAFAYMTASLLPEYRDEETGRVRRPASGNTARRGGLRLALETPDASHQPRACAGDEFLAQGC
jgi:hypothetical protein